MRSNYPHWILSGLLLLRLSLFFLLVLVLLNLGNNLAWPEAFTGSLSQSYQLKIVLSEGLLYSSLV